MVVIRVNNVGGPTSPASRKFLARINYDGFRAVSDPSGDREIGVHLSSRLHVKRGETFEFSLVGRGRHPGADLHNHEAMCAGILVFVQPALHARAIPAQFALHDSDIEAAVVTLRTLAFTAQLAEFAAQYRRRQKDWAPAVAPSRDPAQSVLVLAADQDRWTACLRRFRIHPYRRKIDILAVERRLGLGP